MEMLDRGLSAEHVAAEFGKSVLAVKRQIARLKWRVRDGKIAPAPLPIERAANQPRIYLAGFDVFRRDAKEHGEHLKQLCRDRGFVELYPLDGQVPSSLQRKTPRDNVDHFRGSREPDTGTAFEVGFDAGALKSGLSVPLVLPAVSPTVSRPRLGRCPRRPSAAAGIPFAGW
ncbi:nucleoside 2-deoxyribosyltransferase [Caballeronia telluris]|uniref:Nucleoside 2-deoxyribosyltransferase n=1 Tax=Caballeronia telluris TaxID=326475 RepID=A0A158KDW8_9BURK|nr:nucleoside 2-deoxyribosyltransferase [Caballeronia telluris]SAL79255.1 Nucleoside 2-deoxyribosyltransferase [Caballeronia telluris]